VRDPRAVLDDLRKVLCAPEVVLALDHSRTDLDIEEEE
jgi:hypothetical protein